jgi:hypothetical protein
LRLSRPPLLTDQESYEAATKDKNPDLESVQSALPSPFPVSPTFETTETAAWKADRQPDVIELIQRGLGPERILRVSPFVTDEELHRDVEEFLGEKVVLSTDGIPRPLRNGASLEVRGATAELSRTNVAGLTMTVPIAIIAVAPSSNFSFPGASGSRLQPSTQQELARPEEGSTVEPSVDSGVRFQDEAEDEQSVSATLITQLAQALQKESMVGPIVVVIHFEGEEKSSRFDFTDVDDDTLRKSCRRKWAPSLIGPVVFTEMDGGRLQRPLKNGQHILMSRQQGETTETVTQKEEPPRLTMAMPAAFFPQWAAWSSAADLAMSGMSVNEGAPRAVIQSQKKVVKVVLQEGRARREVTVAEDASDEFLFEAFAARWPLKQDLSEDEKVVLMSGGAPLKRPLYDCQVIKRTILGRSGLDTRRPPPRQKAVGPQRVDLTTSVPFPE